MTYGAGLGGIAVLRAARRTRGRPPAATRRPARSREVSIDGTDGQELATALGTVVRFERDGVALHDHRLGPAGRGRGRGQGALGAWPAPRPSRPAASSSATATSIAVDGVDLTVEPGDVYGYLGPNGAGKTTVLRMLLGLITPDRRRGPALRPRPARATARARSTASRASSRRRASTPT